MAEQQWICTALERTIKTFIKVKSGFFLIKFNCACDIQCSFFSNHSLSLIRKYLNNSSLGAASSRAPFHFGTSLFCFLIVRSRSQGKKHSVLLCIPACSRFCLRFVFERRCAHFKREALACCCICAPLKIQLKSPAFEGKLTYKWRMYVRVCV